MKYDPVALEVFRHRLEAIAEEMGVVLCRSAFSPNIKERQDASCALFDAQGVLIAQAAHIPVHLGSMALAVQQALVCRPLAPGDAVLLNDPFQGGTHLPDLTLVSPVYLPGRDSPTFYVASRAHHADVGGMVPGSMPASREIYQEGLRIPPIRLFRGGHLEEDLLDLILANVRTPEERRGDLLAQMAANRLGTQRLVEWVQQEGLASVEERIQGLLDYAERRMRRVLEAIPDGTYCFEDVLDEDGAGTAPVPLRVSLRIRGDRAEVDFTGSSGQVPGCVNAPYSVTLAAVFYVFRCLVGEDVPTNAGLLRPIRVVAPEGSVVAARPPAGVVGGNVELSQRVVDVLLGALAQALPDRIPAASSGTMNNLTIGGMDPEGRPFTYYETIAGGHGARPDGPGLDATQAHMTNTWNTPIEALEQAYPLRITRYALRRGSGGRGRHRGGQGLIREIVFRVPCRVTLLADRRKWGPYGLAGGECGRPGRTLWIQEGRSRVLPGKVTLEVAPGDRIRILSPGGGGWGREESP